MVPSFYPSIDPEIRIVQAPYLLIARYFYPLWQGAGSKHKEASVGRQRLLLFALTQPHKR